MRFSLGTVIGAIVALVIMESLLRFMPVSSGSRMADTEATKPFSRYLPRQDYVYSHGWTLLNAKRGVANDQGFTNSRDFSGHRGILIVGDSFIESLMLDYKDTVQGQLDLRLGGNVFAASASGNGLADALKISEFYLPRLSPRLLVFFVEPGDLSLLTAPPARGHNGFVENDGAISVIHSNYKESSLKKPIQQSALARYMYYNLKMSDWLSKAISFGRSVDMSMSIDDSHRKAKILGYIFSELRSLAAAGQLRVLFLMDGDRKAIYASDKHQKPTWNRTDRETFISLAEAYGHEVIDMHPVFERYWEEHRERMDYLPADGHWNPVAHMLAADQIFKRIGLSDLFFRE
jgi:hypothetical protein